MSVFAVATVKRENMGDAAGLTSLATNLGGSKGISSITALVTRSTQVHQDLMVRHFSRFAAPFRQQLATIQTSLSAESGKAAHSRSYGGVYQTLQQQA